MVFTYESLDGDKIEKTRGFTFLNLRQKLDTPKTILKIIGILSLLTKGQIQK